MSLASITWHQRPVVCGDCCAGQRDAGSPSVTLADPLNSESAKTATWHSQINWRTGDGPVTLRWVIVHVHSAWDHSAVLTTTTSYSAGSATVTPTSATVTQPTMATYSSTSDYALNDLIWDSSTETAFKCVQGYTYDPSHIHPLSDPAYWQATTSYIYLAYIDHTASVPSTSHTGTPGSADSSQDSYSVVGPQIDVFGRLEAETQGVTLQKSGFREYLTPPGDPPKIYLTETAGGTTQVTSPTLAAPVACSGSQAFSDDGSGDPAADFNDTTSANVVHKSSGNAALPWQTAGIGSTASLAPVTLDRTTATWNGQISNVLDKQTLALSDEYTTVMLQAAVDTIYGVTDLADGDAAAVATQHLARDETFYTEASGHVRAVIDIDYPIDSDTTFSVELIRTETDLETGIVSTAPVTASVFVPADGVMYGEGDWIEEDVPDLNLRIGYAIDLSTPLTAVVYSSNSTFEYLGP